MLASKPTQLLVLIAVLFGQGSIFGQATTWNTPKDLVTAAIGTGRTTGHIATLSVKNTGDIPQSLDIGMFFIPSAEGRFQSYVSFPHSEIITVEPGATVEIPIQGVCVNVNQPPIPRGNSAPPTSTWLVPNGNINPDMPPAFSFNPEGVSTTIRPERNPSVSNIPLAITNDPMQTVVVEVDKYPATAAQFLFDAVTRIRATVNQMQSLGAIRTPFANNPDKEHDAIVQQTIWIYAGALSGDHYTKEQFAERLEQQYVENTGISMAEANDTQKEQFNAGVDQFWDTFELVGLEAKVISVNAPNEVASAVDNVTEKAESAVEDVANSPRQPSSEESDKEDKSESCHCGEISFSLNIKTLDGSYDRKIEVYTGGDESNVSEIDASAAGAKAGDRIEIEISDISFQCACEEAQCETKATRPSYLSSKKKKGAQPGSSTILPKVGASDGDVVINNEDNSEITIQLSDPADETSKSITHIVAVQAICENSDCKPTVCIGHASITF